MNRFSFIFIFLGSLLMACSGSTSAVAPVSEPVNVTTQSLGKVYAKKYIITDGHVDLPYRLQVQNFKLTKEFIGIPLKTDKGDFDYERAVEGGLDAPFMSIFIPASYQDGRAKEFADSLIDMVNGIIDAHPDNFAPGLSADQVEANFEKGLLSLPMGMENGAPIEGDLDNIGYFHQRGIRYITLTHSKDNHICDSSYDDTRTWNGLSPFGKKVIEEMNNTGIMIDISHVSDATFYQVLDITKVPVIASHSSCRKYTPGFERNMSDDMLAKLAENGGVIQINFGTSFLDGEIQNFNNAKREELRNLLNEKGLSSNSDEGKAITEEFQKNNPRLFADVKKVADHIDNVVNIAGIDYVGLGSDYDGVGDSLPTGLKDVSQYPNLLDELISRGYSEEDIAKICYKNVFRVWRAVEEYANTH